MIRLQKFLSNSGIASRRKCEELILKGCVSVNGNVVTELGTKVDCDNDEIKVNGKIVKNVEKKVYILLNKPIGYVTTVSDQFNRDTVMDLVKVSQRVVPVGRLDMYTSGALILSNDGDFVYMVTHPKHEVEKSYTVTVKGKVLDDEVIKLRNGVEIAPGVITNRARVKIIMNDEEHNRTRLEIVIHEGKNRQVRRMCEAVGKKVLALHRSKIGDISVKDLPLGKWRYLTDDEVKKLV